MQYLTLTGDSTMLYNLTFRTNHLTLPLAHQTKVQGMIYRFMETVPEYSAFLHDCGYTLSTGFHFKLFTFGNLTGTHTIQNGMIQFPEQVSFVLRTADPLFAQLLNQILRPGLRCTLGNQPIILSEVHQEVLELSPTCRSLKIRTLSPINVYHSLPNGKTRYYNPLEPEFSQLVNENYHHKWEGAVERPAEDDVELLALSVGLRDKCVTKIKKTWVTAWGGTYLLKGEPKALEFLYHTGLGAKNSMGFGAFEILR
jgi:CRISPR-associated endoribonuclease Cas6